MPKYFYHCETCGNPDIQVSAWVHLNDWTICDNEGPLDTAWCEACQEHSKHYGGFELASTHELAYLGTRLRARRWSMAYHRWSGVTEG